MKYCVELFLNYGPYTITAIIAIIYLVKDWDAFKHQYLRLSALFLTVLLCMVGIGNTYLTNIKNDHQRVADQKRIDALKSAVETSNANQLQNTKQFVVAFSKLSLRVGELQSNVKTVGLREEAD